MSTVLIDVAVNLNEFTTLEKDFAAQYQTATQAEAAILKANLAAAVAAHRLGVIANKIQPLVESGWEDYLKRHGMAIRTVQRAQRIARSLDEERVAKLTLTQADDMAAEIEAVARGNMKSVDEWRKLREKLKEAREALDKQESEREKALANFEKDQETKAHDEYQERAKELDDAAKQAREKAEAEAKKQAEENDAALNAKEMADSLAAEEEGKASIPKPRGAVSTMPPEVAAAIHAPNSPDVPNKADLLNEEQIDWLAERLREIVTERPNDVTDATEDPQVRGAVDHLLAACNGDAEIAYAVMAVWFNDNGL